MPALIGWHGGEHRRAALRLHLVDAEKHRPRAGGNILQDRMPTRRLADDSGEPLGDLDAIVGLRGRVAAGADSRWFFPAYADVGTGESNLTWQVMGGVGHAFKWGEVIAAWRHMEYRFPSDSTLSRLKFDGPAVGATFRW